MIKADLDFKSDLVKSPKETIAELNHRANCLEMALTQLATKLDCSTVLSEYDYHNTVSMHLINYYPIADPTPTPMPELI